MAEIRTPSDCTRPRVFVIGLDGATFDLIRPWAEAGRLPTFARLMEEGTWGVLRSVVPPFTMPAWSSFLTGQSPGRHGVFSFVRRKPGSYEMIPFNASYLRSPTLDRLLNRHGRRVALVNVPATYPPHPVDGILVTGLETPGRHAIFTHPPELGRELIARFDYEIERSLRYVPGEEDRFREAVERVEEKRLQATLWLMDQVDWDLFVVVFRGTDVLGHAFWRFMDPAHPAHDPEEAARYGDVILRHYQQMDEAIATLRAKLGPETVLILMSDHGFGPLYREVYLDNVFAEAGLLHLRRTPLARLRRFLFRLGLTPRNLLRALAAVGLGSLVQQVLSPAARVRVSNRLLMGGSVDWGRTRAYPLGGAGQIYVNLKGREPQGIVEPGREYEEVCALIEQRLRELRDPDTGRPLVKRVWRREEVYGPDADLELPDLYVEWTDDAYTDIGKIGYSRGWISPPLRGRSGGHTPRGIFLAQGPNIRPGRVVEGARLIDLAPTLLHLLGLPVPRHMDGRVLVEIYREPSPVVYEEPPAGEGHRKVRPFSEAEQALVEERLRNLGYIG